MGKTTNTLDLLNRIIEKGGLMGTCAKFYADNLELAETFINECKAQCHNNFAKEYWGEELVLDILNYCQKKTKRVAKQGHSQNYSYTRLLKKQ